MCCMQVEPRLQVESAVAVLVERLELAADLCVARRRPAAAVLLRLLEMPWLGLGSGSGSGLGLGSGSGLGLG